MWQKQFLFVQNGIYALGKAHTRSTDISPVIIAFETVPWLVEFTVVRSSPFDVDCRAFPLSNPVSSRPAVVWSAGLALCPLVASQVPQHFRSFATLWQTTGGCCFPSTPPHHPPSSISAVISLGLGASRTADPHQPSGWLSKCSFYNGTVWQELAWNKWTQ